MVPASRKVAAFALLAASAGFVVAQHASAPVPVAIEKAEPKAQRSTEHRKVHRTAPKIAKRKWEPLPKIKPIPPIMKEEKRERPKVAKKQQQKSITASQCRQLREGVAKHGDFLVRMGARSRGYTDAQLDWALRSCGI